MARLFTSGFELNSATADWISGSSWGAHGTVQTSTVRTGTYALQVQNAGGGIGVTYQFLSVAGGGTFFARTYFRYATAPGSTNSFFTMSHGLGTGASTVALKISSTGTLLLFNGTTQVGSASSALNANQWYRLEIKYDSTGGAGASTLEAAIDGNVFATSAVLTLPTVLILVCGGNQYGEAISTGNWFFDDVALNDNTGSFQNSYPGAGSCFILRPNAAGDSTQWTIGGSSPAATNWQGINEAPPDDAVTLNKDKTLNNADMFTVTGSPMGASDTVNVVQVGVRSNNDTADTTAAFKLQIEKASAGTITQSTAIVRNNTTWLMGVNLGSFGSAYNLTLYQDPDGSNWTNTTIASMQIGYKTTVAHTNFNQITALWAYVDYNPFVAPIVTTGGTMPLMGVG